MLLEFYPDLSFSLEHISQWAMLVNKLVDYEEISKILTA